MKNSKVTNIEFATEISVAKLRASYGKMAEGYFEKEADEMRAKILNTPNTEELYEIKGAKYYVSADGDDQNDGKSPEKAIKTLDGIEALPLKAGDAVLFKRGDIFRFGRTMNAVDGITYGSYGEGVKPKLFGSPENYAENDTWQEVRPNIWKIDFPNTEAGGCILDYGMIAGVQKKAEMIDGLKENGDYCHDLENNIFYMYSVGKPNETWHDIEIMPRNTIIMLRDSIDVTIDNLCLKYTSSFAIHAPDIKNNIIITNCEIGYVGGLWQGTRVRFGNAIEFWAGLDDVHIQNVKVLNNWFYQTYDSGLTWQGSKPDTVYKNIEFSENLFEYNNADIEFFGKVGNVLENFRMERNIMRFTSMGWGTRTFDGGIRGIEGCVRAVTTRTGKEGMDIKSVYFIDNTMDCPARQTINWNIMKEQKPFVHASGSKLYIKSEYRTLPTCLQGLQEDWETEVYDIRTAPDKESLVKLFPRFEEGAEIRWDGK